MKADNAPAAREGACSKCEQNWNETRNAHDRLQFRFTGAGANFLFCAVKYFTDLGLVQVLGGELTCLDLL